MNKEQMIALLESARTDIIGGDSWLGIIDLCSNIADWTEQDEYEFAFDTLKAVQRLWRRMYPKLDGLIYGKELTVTLDDELFSNLKKFAESLPSHTQYDKVSHERHIERDTVSHDDDRSCWTCIHCEYIENDDGSDCYFCHHDDVRNRIDLPVKDCPLRSPKHG